MVSVQKFLKDQWLKIVITIISIVFIIIYIQDQVDAKAIQNLADKGIQWEFFWIGTALALLSNFLDGLAWHRMLKFLDDRISAIDALMTHWIGFSFGIFIPIGGAAEFIAKIAMLEKRYPGINSDEIVSSMTAIRTVFLFTAYIAWGFLLWSLYDAGAMDLVTTIIVTIIVFSLLTLLIFLLIWVFGNIDRLNKVIDYFHSKAGDEGSRLSKLMHSIEEWLIGFSVNFQQIMRMPRKEMSAMLVLVFSQNFIKWISVFYIYLAVVDLPFHIVMVSSVAGGFVNLVPSFIPGSLGLREIARTFSIDVFINDKTTSQLAAIINSIGLYFFFALCLVFGLVYLALLRPSKHKRRTPRRTLSKKDVVRNLNEEADGEEILTFSDVTKESEK